MTEIQTVAVVLILAVSVWLTRFLPFLIFKKTDRLPRAIEYLGTTLPAAMMGLLVIYCFKDVDVGNLSSILPFLLAVCGTVAVHLIKRNTVLSIAAGTAVYMILIRVF